jgi:hypothetical protein
VVLPPRLFSSVTPEKIVELMRLGAGEERPLAVSTEHIVESFYGVPGFPRLESEAALRQAIAQGVRDGVFGYVGHAAPPHPPPIRGGQGRASGCARRGATWSVARWPGSTSNCRRRPWT